MKPKWLPWSRVDARIVSSKTVGHVRPAYEDLTGNQEVRCAVAYASRTSGS